MYSLLLNSLFYFYFSSLRPSFLDFLEQHRLDPFSSFGIADFIGSKSLERPISANSRNVQVVDIRVQQRYNIKKKRANVIVFHGRYVYKSRVCVYVCGDGGW
jgi:hypothetical protein